MQLIILLPFSIHFVNYHYNVHINTQKQVHFESKGQSYPYTNS